MANNLNRSTKSGSTLDELRALSSLIDASVKNIEKCMLDSGATFPSLNEPFTLESEMARLNPAVMEAASHIVAAAAQLTAIVRPTGLSLAVTAFQVSFHIPRHAVLLHTLYQFHLPSALRVAIETNVVEILREAGPQVCVILLLRSCDFQTAVIYRDCISMKYAKGIMRILISYVGVAFHFHTDL